MIAHRGFGERYPENTVPAFRKAAEDASTVEADVRRSGSGTLVVSHFSRLCLVTNATGRVADRTAAELEALSVDGSAYGIPTLDRVLDAIPPHVTVELDLKEPGLAADALAAADEVANDVVVASFYSDALWEARDHASDVPLAYNFDVRIERNLETVRLLNCDRANVHWSLCLATDIVEQANQRGVDVYAWPVGSRLVALAVGYCGVDGVIARCPGVHEWAKRGRAAATGLEGPDGGRPTPPRRADGRR